MLKLAEKMEVGAMRTRQNLNQGWHIRELENDLVDIQALQQSALDGQPAWLATSMPAQVHDILFAHGLIPDPHLGKNAAACAWVAEKDWAYTCTFVSPPGSGPVFLRFKGLDTVAAVYLNGELLGRYANMNRQYTLEVRRAMRPPAKLNTLLIIFTSPLRYIRQQEARYGKTEGIPAHMLLRKSLSDFSDYLGAKPCFAKVGIFAEVVLDIPDQAWLDDVWVRQALSGDLTHADVAVTFTTQGKNARLDWTVCSPDGQKIARGAVPAQNGNFDFGLHYPHLWWPRTHGKAELYTLELALVLDGEICDQRSLKFGVRRTIPILKDAASGENRFAFEINGVLIFLKGACLAPFEGMSRVWAPERARRLLDLAEQADMNILRVWADGEIPDEDFYDECDQRGFLIWQDFMFGYGIHPTWLPGFAAEYRAEAEDNLQRLRGHPCLLLWCGGNENLMAWDFAFRRAPERGGDLFSEILPEACARLDPDRLFHPSSPSLGRVPNWPLEGDWHDYTKIMWSPQASVPLFASEIGRVSAPSLASMRRYLNPEDIWPEDFNPAVRTPGQPAWPPMWEYRSVPGAWEKVGEVEQFCDPAGPGDLVRSLGTAHGEYLQRRVERQRRGIPDGALSSSRRCWGSMVWRLNDAWPISYWALVDYYLEPKIAYYFLRRSYAPVLVCFEQTPDTIACWLVNDSPDEVSGRLVLSHKNFAGALMGAMSVEVTLPPGAARRCLDATDLGVIRLRTEFLQASFNGENVTYLLASERHLHLPAAELALHALENGVEISTDQFARQVTLAASGAAGAVFEDNYFDLAPGEKRTIALTVLASSVEIEARALNAPAVKVHLINY
jgi:beta-mannosidase